MEWDCASIKALDGKFCWNFSKISTIICLGWVAWIMVVETCARRVCWRRKGSPPLLPFVLSIGAPTFLHSQVKTHSLVSSFMQASNPRKRKGINWGQSYVYLSPIRDIHELYINNIISNITNLKMNRFRSSLNLEYSSSSLIYILNEINFLLKIIFRI